MLYYDTDPDWVPTLKLGYEVKRCDTGRHTRLQERKKRKRKSDAAEALLQLQLKRPNQQGSEEVKVKDVACQTDEVLQIEEACQTDDSY